MTYTDDASKLTPEQVAGITHDLENVAVFALEDNHVSFLLIFKVISYKLKLLEIGVLRVLAGRMSSLQIVDC